MRQRRLHKLVTASSYATLLLGSLLWAGTSRATEETVSPADEADDGWDDDDSPVRLNAVIPLWLPFPVLKTTIESDSTLGENIKTETGVGWVVIGSLEAGYRALGARIDAFGIGFEDTLLRRNGEETDVVVESSGFVGRGILMYEFGPWRLKPNKPRWQFSVSPLAGARYNRISLSTGEDSVIDGAYDWTDPLVGGRLDLQMGDWVFGAHTDIGGFGLGSDLAFWASATVDYMITSWFSMWFGWQHYNVLFRGETEGEEETVQVLLTGPSAGVTFHIL